MRSHASHELKANIYRVYPVKTVIESSYSNPQLSRWPLKLDFPLVKTSKGDYSTLMAFPRIRTLRGDYRGRFSQYPCSWLSLPGAGTARLECIDPLLRDFEHHTMS